MSDLTNEIDDDFDPAIIAALLLALVEPPIGTPMGAAIGLVCYALNAPLSPLIIGSITTVVSIAFISIPLVLFMSRCLGPRPDSWLLELLGLFKSLSILFISRVAIGIGLSAAINTIPGITLDINSAANFGAIIGFAVPILTVFAMIYLPPIVEKVKECFSSQEKNSNHTESNDNNKDTLQIDNIEQLRGRGRGRTITT
ncbi:hypothetical protein IYZ83_002225 [Wolbachia pipientis]|uniref:hypothetical protein n=1 Tax=Wolbachia pipientis TaxID=955 RepID=UPI001BD9CC31|nr:hypothetical protein [Wolbachia pipientis]UIP92026.1 hypothetical protein IYZ83_002225 [Wolbachia pipientis]